MAARPNADPLPPIGDDIGEVIRRFREDAGYSLSALAKKSGVSKGYLWSLENGEAKARPSGRTIYRIAGALGVTMSELLGQELLTEIVVDAEIPESLQAFAKREGLKKRDVQMLAAVNFRGQQPEDPDSWEFIWQAIRRSVKS